MYKGIITKEVYKMKPLTPDDVAKKWSQNLSAAGAAIQAGVSAVKVAPGQLAARQKQVYVQNVQAAADKWAANVAKISTQDWQQAMINKAIPRIGTGAQAAQPKMAAFMGQLLPYIERGLSQLPPRGNLEQNKQRVLTWINHMAGFSKTS
jgi:hypothetical protein